MADTIRREPPREQVLICGLGLRLPHITLEVMQALKKCRTVFHTCLDAKTKKYVRSLCRGLRDPGKPGRPEDPKTTADAVLAAAAPGRTVAFLCRGNPMMLHGDALIRRCKSARIPYKVVAGVSPLDELLVALGAPVLGYGLQLYPACAVGPVIALLPAAPALIMSLDRLWGPGKTGAAGFVKRLAKAYPPGHRVTLIRLSDTISTPALRLETDITGLAGALEGLPAAGRQGAALFIPTLEHSKAGLLSCGRSGNKKDRGEQLLLCGLGLRLGHLTLETVVGLKKCRIVFHNFLDKRTERFIRTLCPDLRNSGKLRRRADEEAEADAIMQTAAGGHTVAFLGCGHPLVLQGTAEALLRRCLAADIPYRVITSLSALDEVLLTVGAPIMENGLHICPSNELARFPLSPRIPAIIMGLHHVWDSTGVNMAALIEHLAAVYPREHRVLLIHCSQTEADPNLRVETPLSALAGALESFSEENRFAVTMFIPALA